MKVSLRFKNMLVTDSKAQDVKEKPLSEEKVTKNNRDKRESIQNKGKRGRKKKSVYNRVKQETKITSKTANQERELRKRVEEILQEIKAGIEYLEERVTRWISGVDKDPPTRELAFKMLADTQSYLGTLQHLKKKNEGRKKFIQKCDLKLLKLLLEKSQKLEITIDKAIAEADRLMIMELDEISVDFQTTGKEIVSNKMSKDNKYVKPILKSSSSEPSTEEGRSNKRSISFSEEVDCRYLSCSEQSEHSISSDKTEPNGTSRWEKKTSRNIDLEKPTHSSLNSIRNLHQKSNNFEIHETPDFENLSFQNLTIDTSNNLNRRTSELNHNLERKKNNCILENICRNDPISVQTSQTENSCLMRKTDKGQNQQREIGKSLDLINTVHDINSVQNNCNRSANPEEIKLYTQNDLSQFLYANNFNCDQVFDSTEYIQNQTKDLLKETVIPTDDGTSYKKHELFVRESEKGNIEMDEYNNFEYDKIESEGPNAAVKGRLIINETSLQCPKAYQITMNVNSTGEEGDNKESDFLKLNENSIQLSENFGFSEQTTEPEQSWENFSVMNIKSVRVPDPSEFMPWHPSDPPDNWNDLEDWY